MSFSVLCEDQAFRINASAVRSSHKGDPPLYSPTVSNTEAQSSWALLTGADWRSCLMAASPNSSSCFS
jgi:hypothetical protein